jgi:CheY-like chemotaxis protein
MGRKPWGKPRIAQDREITEQFWLPAEFVKTWPDEDDSATSAARSRPMRVLIVDDNTDLAYLMSMLVQKCGHEVQVAYDGPAALKIAAALHPDVALVDIAMPQMDGLCVARQLRRSGMFDDCLLIAVTGYGDAAHHALGMQAGFDHYMVKPVAFRTLVELLQLARNRLMRSVEERDAERDSIYASAIS